MILALETATKVCSVAYSDNDGSVFEKRTEERGTHSEQLFLFIEKLQQEHGFSISDLEAVLVSQGPGSYTGLRISASAVKGLLFQTEVPLYGINTLASFANQVMRKTSSDVTVHSIIDARRVHVYHQEFKINKGRLEKGNKVEVIPIKALESRVGDGDIIVGTGLGRIDADIRQKAETYATEMITAKSLIRLFTEQYSDYVHKEDPESFEPRYYTSNQV